MGHTPFSFWLGTEAAVSLLLFMWTVGRRVKRAGGPEETFLREEREECPDLAKRGKKRTLRLESRRERWTEEVERVN